MARSYRYLCKKAGLPEPTGFVAPDPVTRRHIMFEVRRADVPRPMALFASDAWAKHWVSTLSQPAKNYQIIPVDVEPLES